MDKVWKIRHKPSGFFYKPATGQFDINLSKKGKVYQHRKPSNPGKGTRLGFGTVGASWRGSNYSSRDTVLKSDSTDDWELVEYVTTEHVIDW